MAKEKANCAGAPWNQVIYEHMWGPTEFLATGNLIDFDLSDRLYKIDIPVLFITGEYDEARPETVSKFQKMIIVHKCRNIDANPSFHPCIQMTNGYVQNVRSAV